MIGNQELTLSWVRTGGICGLLGVTSYILAAFAPLPKTAALVAAFAFGPLVAISAIGQYHCLALHRRTPSLQAAVVFAVAGGVTVLIMLTAQQSIFELMQRATARADSQATKDLLVHVTGGVNAVQLGMDVAWDVLIGLAVVLFGWHMIRHPAFGRIMGGIGVLLGLLLLSFNIAYFPVPPAESNSIDWGPFTALWMVVSFVLQLRSQRWVKATIAATS